MKNEVRRHRFIPRKVLALFLTILMLLSITPVLTVGDTNPYQSLVDPPTGSAPATSVVDRTKAGNEFTVTIIGDASGPTDIFVASSRPSVDTFFYKKGSADWAPLTVSTGGGDGLSSTDIYVTVFIGANTNTISGNTEELALKVVSSSPGTSQIVFGIDAKDTVDYARGRSLSNGTINIIQQRRFAAEFSSPGGGGDVPGPINPYLSTVTAPSGPAYAATEADEDAAGAEFTLNLV
ncbi:MAG: hypothetical protein LBH09_06555, partial [Peptococcaceae bacterium]|nr:hypothetical protein [Peptococcaceae bacterium]